MFLPASQIYVAAGKPPFLHGGLLIPVSTFGVLCQVETLEEVEELVVLGGRNRTVGNNNVNEHSSRSHLVLQVHIAGTDFTTGHVQNGKLNLIDLAGSERIKVRHQ